MVGFVSVQLQWFLDINKRTVDAQAHKSGLGYSVLNAGVRPFSPPDEWSEDIDLGTLSLGQKLPGDLFDGLSFDLFSALVAVRRADAGEQ